jgi:predicted O-methyltransferase YrrM
MNFARVSNGVALEVGVCEAGSLVFFAKACLRRGIRRIYGIDLFPNNTYEAASSRLRKHGLDNYVTLFRSHSLKYRWKRKIDVLHLDADHEYKAVRADIEKYAPFVSDGGIIIFDDYDTAHPGVQRAVNLLLARNRGFEPVGINYEGAAFGSICLRKRNKVEVRIATPYVTFIDRLLRRS